MPHLQQLPLSHRPCRYNKTLLLQHRKKGLSIQLFSCEELPHVRLCVCLTKNSITKNQLGKRPWRKKHAHDTKLTIQHLSLYVGKSNFDSKGQRLCSDDDGFLFVEVNNLALTYSSRFVGLHSFEGRSL